MSRRAERRRTIQVVGAAILEHGRCLAVQRSETMREALKWEFPGGKVEPGERPEEALRREVFEELALEVEVGERLGRGSCERPGRRIVLDVYLARPLSGSLTLREHRSSRWLGAGELTALDWAEADIPVVHRLAAYLRGR